jgi:hypothetical protein
MLDGAMSVNVRVVHVDLKPQGSDHVEEHLIHESLKGRR